MNFTDFNLSETLIQAIQDCRFKEATKVQQEVIPVILEGKDVVVKAKTGSGKTSAFAIPIIENIRLESPLPTVLIITPTRELADQVSHEMSLLGKYKKIKSIAVYGKKPIQTQINQLKDAQHIVVGTPGRLKDLISRKALKLEDINYLVLDEADELINRGFFDDVIDIIHELPTIHQTLLFSATMSVEIQELCQTYMSEPHWVEIVEASPKIKEINYLVEDQWKFLRLRVVIATINPYTCIIFCNTQVKVEELYNRMRQVGMKPLRVHGGLKQKDRLKAIETFKKGDAQCLIATDLVARGIHIDSLDLVVNYDLPQIPENYVHRIGRTGRVGEDGIAVTLFTPSDEPYKLELEKYLASAFSFSDFDNTTIENANINLSNSEKRLLQYSLKTPRTL